MRQKLGVAEDADEATILAALDEALDERSSPLPPPPPRRSPRATSWSPQATSRPRGASRELSRQAEAGAAAPSSCASRSARRSSTPTGPSSLPANREAWAKEYDRDPRARAKHFESAPELIPTAEIGHEVTPEAKAEDDSWFPGYGTPTPVKEA
jgi:hypothetical protein